MHSPSLYWYDYETFGTDPRTDRIAQFAGIRTDMDFNIIEEPVDIYCRASNDILPNPEACLITGITPQKTFENGLIEAEFISLIEKEFATPNTCVVGFNSIRFDDEFTRYSLYRNFFDPYAREWQNGCSRWDIIDLVRMTRALRPEGIEWPVDENGIASNRLELITKANGISHEAAHDALSDVYATIALAKLIKDKQPRLFDFVFENKKKQKISKMLNLYKPEVVLHTSGMYPSTICNTTVVYPLAQHPTNKNGIIVFDLRFSPEDLKNLSAEEIIKRLYTPRDQLPEGVERIPLKTIHINKCPVIAPVKTLDEASSKRTEINQQQYTEHLKMLQDIPDLNKKLNQIFSHNPFSPETDPDKSLYGGGFFSPDDKKRMDDLRQLREAELANVDFNFKDKRIPEMIFRYRARNYPGSLSNDENIRWNEYRTNRFTDNETKNNLSFEVYNKLLTERLEDDSIDNNKKKILHELQEWGQSITEDLNV
ncbi:MAG: exodeoxyribonuclease I [endosymbiont of Galathealinum brachiosum]|uniref:Exodeoxyribonuclease I n=1 Tax=endosymbiont of Galathealinum brachiosum TaxID=2200906 RepID=A0A370DIF5_9GAMM|nr:MAG: exodeoxyribonuclease I [endosymbiont of Galathealinum brachiosum]